MTSPPDPVAEFVARWKVSGGGEIANSQSFLKELCTLLGVPQPDPTVADEDRNTYVFEKAVVFNNGDGTLSHGRVDLYRRGGFVLESKQGSERKDAERQAALAQTTRLKKHRAGTAERGTRGWEQAMRRAFHQAKGYAEAIPGEWPPFLIVCDVGHCFDLYADFTQSGKNYVPFPDPQNYRVRLDRLNDEAVRQTFSKIWTDPHALDPARISAAVTRQLAAKLAELAKRLESRTDDAGRRLYAPGATGSASAMGDPLALAEPVAPERVAAFLMRCLFTMFAEDIGLVPENGFTDLLVSLRGAPRDFAPMVESLWQTMDTGGFSPVLRKPLLRFNGGLFADHEALPLTADQLELLIEAGEAQWRDVEPAIFGTLLERALDPVERHKLGAHYTPRAYVERLVMPTLIEPLRQEWDTAYAAAVLLDADGKTADAVRTVRRFHERLCEVRVLDPACGSGNFLYVALELMKRLEGDVLNALREFGEAQMPLLTVDPHQFLGIEVNPRAAAITDLVLWIGYLQWHFRTRGTGARPAEPVIKDYDNVQCRDAVLAWDAVADVTDAAGRPVTRWDGRTTKPHPVTGAEVPDDSAQVTEKRYLNPRKAEWPKADYIVGNPPFIGNKRMRQVLGWEYVDALRNAVPEVPESCDYVLYWWHLAATLAELNQIKRFGLITTNSITQTFSQRVVKHHLSTGKLSLVFAIPDHPWVDTADGAAVRVAMTVGSNEIGEGRLFESISETGNDDATIDIEFASSVGSINSNLSVGSDVSSAVALQSNAAICGQGVKLVDKRKGFFVDESYPRGSINPNTRQPVVRTYVSTDQIKKGLPPRFVIDFFGLTEAEALAAHPDAFQRVIDFVKPERDHNRRDSIRLLWWRFGWERPVIRKALRDLDRYILTMSTAKHRYFAFVDAVNVWDGSLFAIATDDPFVLGVLSSRPHAVWALEAGGTLEDRPTWTNTTCFAPFPFPDPDEPLRQRIRELGEQLDGHRKRQQGLHPALTMTGMYNVLEKLRSGEALSAKERAVHGQGLVSVLRQIHDDLDVAVADAYGWPHDLSDEAILERLVALNAHRAAEEAAGTVRYLRPDFQRPAGPRTPATQQALDIGPDETPAPTAKPAKGTKRPWPKSLPERFQAVRAVLEQSPTPLAVADCRRHFQGAKADTVAELLETLATLGQARQTEDGRFVA